MMSDMQKYFKVLIGNLNVPKNAYQVLQEKGLSYKEFHPLQMLGKVIFEATVDIIRLETIDQANAERKKGFEILYAKEKPKRKNSCCNFGYYLSRTSSYG